MSLLGRQIIRRFQAESDNVQPIFAGLTIEQIEKLAERFVDARSLDEIRGWADELRKAS